MARHRLHHAAALAIALAAVAVPAADARPDGPTPELRSTSLAGTAGSVDLRTPDARDAGTPAATPKLQDQRSPDARDAATRAVTGRVPTAPVADGSSCTSWDDVAIVGGGAAAGLLLLGSGAIVTTRRRDAARKARTVVLSR
jgi:hypothetical protein